MKIRKGDKEFTDLQGLAYLAQRTTCFDENTECKNCPMLTVSGLCRNYALYHPEDTLSRLGWELVEEDEPECEACEIHYSTEGDANDQIN